MGYRLYKAQANHLFPVADESVQCVVTSPPYWGLRKYSGEQELIWDDEGTCVHQWVDNWRAGITGGQNQGSKADNPNGTTNRPVPSSRNGTCLKCGAWRGAYGLEPTIEMYVAHTVEILRELRRVLKKDGVVFWNIGDSYATAAGKGNNVPQTKWKDCTYPDAAPHRSESGLKGKDLCLIPARVALAAQAQGWWVRSDIIWHKPNPMPESVRDRPTDAYEHVLMFTKSAKYFWDAQAVAEPSVSKQGDRRFERNDVTQIVGRGGTDSRKRTGSPTGPTRNIRNVWTIPTQPYKGAHFATFPEELPRRCIKAASRVSDIVLDPFCGSGTTGKVALELGRNFIGTDLAYQDLGGRKNRSVPAAAVYG